MSLIVMKAVATQSVPSIERALDILELLARSKYGLTLPEIVQKTRLPKSSVHCILVTLQRHQYLHRNEKTGRYLFGLKLLTLAGTALDCLSLREQATPLLYSLMQQTGLAVHMAVLRHKEVILVARVAPYSAAKIATWIGKQMEIHCTGVGKAIGAFLPNEDLTELLRSTGLPRHNENTITSQKKLREDFNLTRQRGYSIDDEEDEIGLRCIGVPVVNGDEEVVGAVSIAGTSEQFREDNVRQLVACLKQTAASVSAVWADELGTRELSLT